MQQSQSQQDPVSNLIYRVERMEMDISQLKSQLTLYEPARENDLKLQRINDTVQRIEHEVQAAKTQLVDLNNKLVVQEVEGQKRDAAQQAQQANLQISTLKWVVGIGLSALLLLLGAYFTHILH